MSVGRGEKKPIKRKRENDALTRGPKAKKDTALQKRLDQITLNYLPNVKYCDSNKQNNVFSKHNCPTEEVISPLKDIIRS